MKRTFLRRIAASATCMAATCVLTMPAAAQGDWPARPIRLIVPYPPGTGPDVTARILLDGLGKALNTTFFVENRAGANAIIGTNELTKSPADGYSFLLVDRLTLSVNPLLYRPLPYDPRKDMVSVGAIADDNLYLVVSTRVPAIDFKSFIAHAKANPGALRYGSGGVGSIMHLNMELLEAGTGASFLHVPFKALAEVIPAMLGDQVDVSVGGAASLWPHVQKGTMRLLAVGAPARATLTPDIPTIEQASGGDMLLSTGYSVHARAGVAPVVVARMNAALRTVLMSPEVQASLAGRGLKPTPSTPAEVDAMIAADGARVGKLIRERGIKVQ